MPKCKCNKRAIFGFREDARATCCKTCKLDGMIDTTNRRCDCGKSQPRFGFEGDARATCCVACKRDGMIDIKTRRCDCGKSSYPIFGFEGDARATCCASCKRDGMKDIKTRRCDCGKSRPTFGFEGDARATCCKACKRDGMVDIKSRRCNCGDSRPTFGFEGDARATCCAACKRDGMVDVVSRKCECGKSKPNFGFEGDVRATCCAACKRDGMVDVVSRKCECGKSKPTFGFEGDARATCCAACKRDGMVDIMSRRCARETCNVIVSRSSTWFPYCAGCYAKLHPDDPLVVARFKTEEKIFLFFRGSLGGGDSIGRNLRGVRAPSWVGSYELDFLTSSPGAVNIECDGEQHFRLVEVFQNTADGGVQRDIEKTTLAFTNGVSVVRIVQTDVWSDRFDWRALIRAMLSFAANAARSGCPAVLFGASDATDVRYTRHATALEGTVAKRAYLAWMETSEVMALRCLETDERMYWRSSPDFSLGEGCSTTGEVWEGRVKRQKKIIFSK